MKHLKLFLKRVAITLGLTTLLIALTGFLTYLSIVQPLYLTAGIILVVIVVIGIITWGEVT